MEKMENGSRKSEFDSSTITFSIFLYRILSSMHRKTPRKDH